MLWHLACLWLLSAVSCLENTESLLGLPLVTNVWLVNTESIDGRGFEESLRGILPHYYPLSGGDDENDLYTESYADVRFEIEYKIHAGSSGGQEKSFMELYREFITNGPMDGYERHVLSISSIYEFMKTVGSNVPVPLPITPSLASLSMLVIASGDSGAMRDLPRHIIVSDDDAQTILHDDVGQQTRLGGQDENKCLKSVTLHFAFFDDTAEICPGGRSHGQMRRGGKGVQRLDGLPYSTRLLRIVTSGVEAFAASTRLGSTGAAGEVAKVAVESDKVYIPVVLFKNGTSGGTNVGLNVDVLQEWAQSLLLPHQQAILFSESVALTDHPQVMMALASAEQHFVVPSGGAAGEDAGSGLGATRVPYLDPNILTSALMQGGGLTAGTDEKNDGDSKSQSQSQSRSKGKRGRAAGDKLLARLLLRVGHAEEALTEAAMSHYKGHGHKTSGSGNKKGTEVETLLQEWLSELDRPEDHTSDTPRYPEPDPGEQGRTGVKSGVTVLPVFLFSGLELPLHPGTATTAGATQRLLQPLWASDTAVEVAKEGGVTLGLGLVTTSVAAAASAATGSGSDVYVCPRQIAQSQTQPPWRSNKCTGDATRVAAAAIASAFGVRMELCAPGDGRMWGDGVNPFSSAGIFPAHAGASASASASATTSTSLADLLGELPLLFQWTARRTLMATRIALLLHESYRELDRARGMVRRVVVAMHSLSHTGLQDHLSSSSSSSDNGAGVDLTPKRFLDSLDLQALEGDMDGPGSSYHALSKFLEANRDRIKTRVSAESKGGQAQLHATTNAEALLQTVAGHVIALEQELHFLRERSDYTAHNVGVSLGRAIDHLAQDAGAEHGHENEEDSDENLLREAASALYSLELGLRESKVALGLIWGQVEAVLGRCELQWDVVEDDAVYMDLKTQKEGRRHWWEHRAGALPGGSVRLSRGGGRGGVMRGLVQALVGIFSPPRGRGEPGIDVSSPRSLERALKASSGGPSRGGAGAGATPPASGWTFILVVLVAVCVAALAWLWLRDRQRVAKKMA